MDIRTKGKMTSLPYLNPLWLNKTTTRFTQDHPKDTKQAPFFNPASIFIFMIITGFNLFLNAQTVIPGMFTNPADYVNPFIGTGGHGHTYPGPCLPFGMVQLSPDTRLEGWDGCSGYHYSDSLIYGFSHTHLSGTGVPDYCDILFTPVTGEVIRENQLLPKQELASGFSHDKETARAGFYSVILDKYDITAELTTTLRAGFHRYTYPGGEDPVIIIDLDHRDVVVDAMLKVISETEVEGCRVSTNWADEQHVYFVARFSRPIKSYGYTDGKQVFGTIPEAKGKYIRAFFNFDPAEENELLVQVGISGVSLEGARKNLDAELKDWNFDKVRDAAKQKWNHELSKITIKDPDEQRKAVFYTALYHAFVVPNIYNDVDGRYRGRDMKIHESGSNHYTVFSLWDTFRAEHPLFTLIQQDRTNDFIGTFLRQYDEGGLLPVWELSACETGCMIGYHAIPVIADAWIKGIRGYNEKKAYEAMKKSAMKDHLGLKFYKENGVIQSFEEHESVSKQLEYAYDDWCIARVAKELGTPGEYSNFIERAQFYKNLFDPSTGFMRPKNNSTWHSPFDPREVNMNFTEANSWQYSFFIPQDISGLMKLHGGKEGFIKKLDQLFSESSETTGREQSDITGLIGQYAHGNEPSHHMAYLYCFAGQPWKTQKLVNQIMTELYHNNPDGLSGNEDCGQMSAWYVMSAMGFYSVTPGLDYYVIGKPAFNQLTLYLESGKNFTVKAHQLSSKNIYIQSASLDGLPYTRCYIKHEDIIKGGELVFEMGSEPNKIWGSTDTDLPVSGISENLIEPIPFVAKGTKVFTGSTEVEIATINGESRIFFTLDGSEPGIGSTIYEKPISITENTVLKAVAINSNNIASRVIKAGFNKISDSKKLSLLSKYSPQYTAGGDMALVDGFTGSANFRTGQWQGYEGVDLVAIIDLGAEESIHKITTGFIQDAGAWIFSPLEVVYEVSDDGTQFTLLETIPTDVKPEDKKAQLVPFTSNQETKARYIKITAKNRGICPPGHPGEGGKSWIFADEITVE